MKRILAYGGHLLAATFVVPWLTILTGGLTYGNFRPFLASASTAQHFFSDHVVFLAFVAGASLAYSVSGTLRASLLCGFGFQPRQSSFSASYIGEKVEPYFLGQARLLSTSKRTGLGLRGWNSHFCGRCGMEIGNPLREILPLCNRLCGGRSFCLTKLLLFLKAK